MEVFVNFYDAVWSFFQMEMTVFGFTFSFANMLFFSVFAGLVVDFVGRHFDLFG